MRSPRTFAVRIVVQTARLAGTLALACETPVAPPQQPLPEPSRAERFSAAGAWSHLEALSRIGPRVSGTEGAERARQYIVSQLEGHGIAVQVRGTALEAGAAAESEREEASAPEGEQSSAGREPRNVLGVIPGPTEDLVVLVAPYDTRPFDSFEFVGANDGGSGTALLLALAENLADDPLPYTTWLLFLDGEAQSEEGGLRGSRAEAERLLRDGLIPRVRLLLALNRICDPDLRIARDLLSHRIYRDEFWKAALRLGYREFFEQERFEQPQGSHWPFLKVGVRRAVALMDTSFGGEVPPGLYADTEDDDLEHCSESSLGIVGAVTLEALETLTRRLVKIDRFSTTPALEMTESEEVEASPVPEESETAEPGEGDGSPASDPPDAAPLPADS